MRTQLEAHKVPFDVIDVAQDSDALIHTSTVTFSPTFALFKGDVTVK